MAVITAEVQYLMGCLRAWGSGHSLREVAAPPPPGFDWDALLGLAYRHSVMPLLYWVLRGESGAGVPGPVMDRLAEGYRVNARRNRILGRELRRLVGLIEARGVRVIPYKGPEMAARFYEDPGLREFKDLDLLIRPEDVEAVWDLLIEDGYGPYSEMDARRRSLQRRQYKDYGFIRSGLPHHPEPLPDIRPREHPNFGRMIVEPHWSVTARRFPFPVDYGALFDRAQRVTFEDAEISSCPLEELLLILCVNGAKSVWVRLLMICDLAAMIRSQPALDYERCLELAGRLGCERIALLGLALAHKCCAAPLPGPVAARVTGDEAVMALVGQICEQFFAQPRTEGLIHTRFFSSLVLRMRERRADRLCYLFHSVTEPGAMHMRYIPLPEALFPLYRVIVPLSDFVVVPALRLLRRRAGSSRGTHTGPR